MTAIATGPQVAQTPTRRGADTAVDARANGQERSGEAERREYEGWRRRVEEATKLRDRFDKAVWSPLYERWATARMRGKLTDEISNPWQQFAEVVLPHLLGDEREILCRVNRVAAGEDPEEKAAFADVLANLATALPHACGVYKDALGRRLEPQPPCGRQRSPDSFERDGAPALLLGRGIQANAGLLQRRAPVGLDVEDERHRHAGRWAARWRHNRLRPR
jgi:hypothetical protein